MEGAGSACGSGVCTVSQLAGPSVVEGCGAGPSSFGLKTVGGTGSAEVVPQQAPMADEILTGLKRDASDFARLHLPHCRSRRRVGLRCLLAGPNSARAASSCTACYSWSPKSRMSRVRLCGSRFRSYPDLIAQAASSAVRAVSTGATLVMMSAKAEVLMATCRAAGPIPLQGLPRSRNAAPGGTACA
jgi:hypothetical protein